MRPYSLLSFLLLANFLVVLLFGCNTLSKPEATQEIVIESKKNSNKDKILRINYDNKYYLYNNQLSETRKKNFLSDIIKCMGVIDVVEEKNKKKIKIGEIIKDGARCYVEYAEGKYSLNRTSSWIRYSIRGSNKIKESSYRLLPDFLIVCESMLIKSIREGAPIIDEEGHCINIFKAVMGNPIGKL